MHVDDVERTPNEPRNGGGRVVGETWLVDLHTTARDHEGSLAGGAHVAGPVAVGAVREGDGPPVGGGERHHGCAVRPPRAAAAVLDDHKGPQPARDQQADPIRDDAVEPGEPPGKWHATHRRA